MKKRGQLVYKAIVVIIASAIVIFAFLQAGKSYGNQEAFYKLAVAKDLALTLDLIYGLPGDIIYTYPNGVSQYDIEVIDNKIKIYNHEIGKNDPTAASYSFAGIASGNLKTEIKAMKFVKIEKKNNKIEITGVPENFVAGGGNIGGGGHK